MTTQVTTNPDLAARFNIERLLKIREVEILTSMHRQTIWRKSRDGTFPKARKLGPINVWPESEIRAWLAGVLDGRQETDSPKPVPPQLRPKRNGAAAAEPLPAAKAPRRRQPGTTAGKAQPTAARAPRKPRR